MTKAENDYKAALERLIANKAKVVDTASPKFRINKESVAREAGVTATGAIRPARYPELCEQIQEAEEKRLNTRSSDAMQVDKLTGKAKHAEQLKDKANERYNTLKKEHQQTLNALLNAVRENYELKRELKELKKQGAEVKQEPEFDFNALINTKL